VPRSQIERRQCLARARRTLAHEHEQLHECGNVPLVESPQVHGDVPRPREHVLSLPTRRDGPVNGPRSTPLAGSDRLGIVDWGTPRRVSGRHASRSRTTGEPSTGVVLYVVLYMGATRTQIYLTERQRKALDARRRRSADARGCRGVTRSTRISASLAQRVPGGARSHLRAIPDLKCHPDRKGESVRAASATELLVDTVSLSTISGRIAVFRSSGASRTR